MKKIPDDIFEKHEMSYKAFKLIMETTFDEITITDQHGRFIDVSSSCEKTFGRNTGELIGKTCFELEKEGVFTESVTKSVLERKQQTTIVQETSGGKRLVVTGIPMFDDDQNLIGVINTSKDITEVEELKYKIKDTESLLAWYYGELNKQRFVENSDIIAKSDSMRNIIETITHIADHDTTVLLTGNTGVGKSYIAELIHNISCRKDNPFIHVNCGSIPESLLESELFGYEKGAFTGANELGNKGFFEVAGTGTLFLDEIGELPVHLQVKLLTILEKKEAFRVGGREPFKVNARIISATNQNIQERVKEGKFRSDLYYRLNVIPIYIPTLKERPEDLLTFIENILEKLNHKYYSAKSLSPEAYDKLLSYDWPGNIRELENLLERIIVTTPQNIVDDNQIDNVLPEKTNTNLICDDILPLHEAIAKLEKTIIINAFKKYRTTRKIAEVLEIDQSTVSRKLKKLKLR